MSSAPPRGGVGSTVILDRHEPLATWGRSHWRCADASACLLRQIGCWGFGVPVTQGSKSFGFWAGARTVLAGLAWLSSTPGVWGAALVPFLVLLLLCGSAVYGALIWIKPWVASFFGEAVSVLDHVLLLSVSWVAAALAAFLGFIVAWLLTPALSSPALERVVGAREQSLGAPPRTALGFWAELGCGLRAQLVMVLVVVPLMALLWFIDWLLPMVVLATFPLKITLTVLGLAWSLLDYPLTLRGVPMGERRRLISDNLWPVLGFGAAFSVLFWIPLSSVILLPVGAAASAELSYRMLQRAQRL